MNLGIYERNHILYICAHNHSYGAKGNYESDMNVVHGVKDRIKDVANAKVKFDELANVSVVLNHCSVLSFSLWRTWLIFGEWRRSAEKTCYKKE